MRIKLTSAVFLQLGKNSFERQPLSYGRSVLIASIVSEIMIIRAPRGIASPAIPSG